MGRIITIGLLALMVCAGSACAPANGRDTGEDEAGQTLLLPTVF